MIGNTTGSACTQRRCDVPPWNAKTMSDIKHSCQQQPQDRARNKESSKRNNMSLCIVIIPIMFANVQPQEIKVSNGGLASVQTTKRVRVSSESFRVKVCTITR